MNLYINAVIITIVFLLFRFIDMKYFEKEPKPLKYFVKDAVFCYFSVIVGTYIILNLSTMMENMDDNMNNPSVFTSAPEF